jgi:hypothetical protein
MAKPSIRELHASLSRDLQKPGSKISPQVVDDAVRKVFTTNRDGAVFVFAHKQNDPAFWIGVKHYGSGTSSRIRMRRTPVESSAEAVS